MVESGPFRCSGFGFTPGAELLRPPLSGADLLRVDAIEVPTDVRDAWGGVDLRVAVDVTNPLLGPTGAARVFGPQKGADPEGVERLETGLSRWASLLAREFGEDQVRQAAGADGARVLREESDSVSGWSSGP